MPLEPIDKALSILSGITDEQIEELPPAERRRLADQCLKMAIRAAPDPKEQPKAGVLYDLRDHRSRT